MAINIRTVRLQAPAANEGQDYVITDFGVVDAAIVLCGVAGSDGSDVAPLNQSCGFWDTSNVVHWCAYMEDAVAEASANGRSNQDETYVAQMLGTGVDGIRLATIAAQTNGVTLTWTGSNTAVRPYTIVILINGINGAQAGALTPNASDAGTAVATTTGITPKVVFGGMNRRNAIDGNFDWKSFSFGFAHDTGSGIDESSLAWLMLNGTAAHLYSSTNEIAINLGSASVDTTLDITAMAANSFTATTNNVDGSGAADSDLYYLALDFDESAAIFNATTPTDTSDFVPLTGGSFTPGSVLMLPTFETTINARVANNSAGFYGIYVADGTDEFQLGWNDEDSAATNSNSSGRTDQRLWNSTDTGGAADFDASTPVFTSGQISMTTSNAGSKASYVLGIAFEGVIITDVDTDDIVGAAQTPWTITGTGFGAD